MPIPYKGIKVSADLRLDLLVEDKVIVDLKGLKAQQKLSPIDKPKLLTYLRLSDKHLGLIINFHVELLRMVSIGWLLTYRTLAQISANFASLR